MSNVQLYATDLDRGFRQVVRIPQLGCDVELEVVGVLNGGVAKLDTQAAALLERLLEQERLQDGVQLFLDVLKQDLVWEIE